MFDTLTNSFKGAIDKIRFYDDDKALKKALIELKKSLLKADVHHKVVKELLANVEKEVKGNVGKESFLKALEKDLTRILTAEGNQGFVFASKPPTVVLMIGLQGSGKTTTTGKLAHFLKEFQDYEEKTLQLLENSFLSLEAKERYKALFLDRLRAIRYKFK